MAVAWGVVALLVPAVALAETGGGVGVTGAAPVRAASANLGTSSGDTLGGARAPLANRAARRDGTRAAGFGRTLGDAVAAGRLPFAGLPLWTAALMGIAALMMGGLLLFWVREVEEAAAAYRADLP